MANKIVRPKAIKKDIPMYRYCIGFRSKNLFMRTVAGTIINHFKFAWSMLKMTPTQTTAKIYKTATLEEIISLFTSKFSFNYMHTKVFRLVHFVLLIPRKNQQQHMQL